MIFSLIQQPLKFFFVLKHPSFRYGRLHEFDEQVSAVREGMARVVPVPLLSLFTGYELETMVSADSFQLGNFVPWLCCDFTAMVQCLLRCVEALTSHSTC